MHLSLNKKGQRTRRERCGGLDAGCLPKAVLLAAALRCPWPWTPAPRWTRTVRKAASEEPWPAPAGRRRSRPPAASALPPFHVSPSPRLRCASAPACIRRQGGACPSRRAGRELPDRPAAQQPPQRLLARQGLRTAIFACCNSVSQPETGGDEARARHRLESRRIRVSRALPVTRIQFRVVDGSAVESFVSQPLRFSRANPIKRAREVIN